MAKDFPDKKPLQGSDEGTLYITPAALSHLGNLIQQDLAKDPTSKPCLRIRVDAGGCSGFQYHLSFDPKPTDGDIVMEREGVFVSIDPMSLSMLSGGVLDYATSLMGAAFAIHIPDAASSCGCGSSFSPF